MKLKPGDIILFKVVAKSPWHDKLIALGELLLNKQFTRDSYCHVAMVDSDTALMLEAVWPKTHVIPLRCRGNVAEVYRVKGATSAQVKQALKWAHENVGLWYNVGKLFFGLFPSRHKVLCSTYVAKAWKSTNVTLGDIDEKIFSPDEIAANKKVVKFIKSIKLPN
ncbi:MAG: hypothetical protein ACREBR_05765 [bacterium]